MVIGGGKALALAATMSVGRLSNMRGDQLFAAPASGLLEQRDKLVTQAREYSSAAFEVNHVVDWSRSGWGVFLPGLLREVTDPETIGRVRHNSLRPWTAGDRNHVLRLTGQEVTGRRLEPGPDGTTIVESPRS